MPKPSESAIKKYEDKSREMKLGKFQKWVWKHRIRNAMSVGRRRRQTSAKVNVVTVSGSKLSPRDNKVNLFVVMKLLENGYPYTQTTRWKDGAVWTEFRLLDIQPKKRRLVEI